MLYYIVYGVRYSNSYISKVAAQTSDITSYIYRYTRIKYINHIRIYTYIAAAYTYIALRPLSLVNSKRVEVRNTIYFTVRPSSVMGFHIYIGTYNNGSVPIFKRIVNTYIYIMYTPCTLHRLQFSNSCVRDIYIYSHRIFWTWRIIINYFLTSRFPNSLSRASHETQIPT